MMRIRSSSWGFVLLALGLAVPLVQAAPKGGETPLDIVPAGSPIVVHIHGYERTKNRLITMVKNAIPDLGAKAEAAINDGIKKGLEGREIKGLVADGSIFVVFTEVPKPGVNIPSMAVIVSVTSYTEFRDGFLKEEEKKTLKTDPAGFEEVTFEKETAYFVDRKNYAIITPVKEVAIQFTKKEKGIDNKLDKVLAKKLLESDVAVYVDTEAINKEYGEQIKQGKAEFENSLDQVAGQFSGPNKKNMEMMKLIIGPMFQAFVDSKGFLSGVEFRPDGFALHAEATVGEDSKTNKFLKTCKPAGLADLAKLPQGKLYYTGMEIAPTLLKGFGPFLYGILFDAESKEGKALKDAIEQIGESKPKTFVGAAGMPALGLQVWSYEDPVRASTAQLKLFQSIKGGESFGQAMLKENPKIKVGAEKHREFELHSVALAYDIESMVNSSFPGGGGTEDQKRTMVEMLKKTVGEGANIWFGSDGKTFVQISAAKWEDAKASLDQYLDKKNGVGENKEFQQSRKNLPKDVTLAGLMDIPQYATLMAQIMEPLLGVFPVPLPPGVLTPAVKGETCYMGIAATLQPQRASFDLWFPGKGANEIYKMFVEKALKGG